MLDCHVDVKKVQSFLQARRASGPTQVKAKPPVKQQQPVTNQAPVKKPGDAVTISTASVQAPVESSPKSEAVAPVRLRETPEAVRAKPQEGLTGPLTMGLEPVYVDELKPLESRYPGVAEKLGRFENEAACKGYCPVESPKLEQEVIQNPPWPKTEFGDPRANITAKAKELQEQNPTLKSSNPKDYDFQKASVAAEDLMETLDGMFPKDQFPGIAMSARAKTPQSLSKKMEKQTARSPDFSLGHLTDTVGARIDAPDLKKMGDVAKAIEQRFDGKIVAKSDYVSQPGDNGYRALHYIVDIGGRMAEIQTSTTSLRAADLATHDTVYKPEFPVSQETAKELSTAADRIMFLECLKTKGK